MNFIPIPLNVKRKFGFEPVDNPVADIAKRSDVIRKNFVRITPPPYFLSPLRGDSIERNGEGTSTILAIFRHQQRRVAL